MKFNYGSTYQKKANGVGREASKRVRLMLELGAHIMFGISYRTDSAMTHSNGHVPRENKNIIQNAIKSVISLSREQLHILRII